MFTLIKLDNEFSLVPYLQSVPKSAEIVGISFYNLKTYCFTVEALNHMRKLQGRAFLTLENQLVMENLKGEFRITEVDDFQQQGGEWPVAFFGLTPQRKTPVLEVGKGFTHPMARIARYVREYLPRAFKYSNAFVIADQIQSYLRTDKSNFHLKAQDEYSYGELVVVRLPNQNLELASVVANVGNKVQMRLLYQGHTVTTEPEKLFKVITSKDKEEA